MSGLAVRILVVVASPVRRSGPVRILETPLGLACYPHPHSAVSHGLALLGEVRDNAFPFPSFPLSVFSSYPHKEHYINVSCV